MKFLSQVLLSALVSSGAVFAGADCAMCAEADTMQSTTEVKMTPSQQMKQLEEHIARLQLQKRELADSMEAEKHCRPQQTKEVKSVEDTAACDACQGD